MPSPVPVAQDCYNSGDRWLPGEEAGRCKCALYCPSDAGLPGKTLGVTVLGMYITVLHVICGHLAFLCFLFQPPQFKLDPRLARLLGIHTQTRPVIIQALWQYIKTHKLQDPHEREYVICDKYLQQVTAWLQQAAVSAFHRITERSGLEGTSGGHPAQPPAQAGSPRAGCTAPRPGGS